MICLITFVIYYKKNNLKKILAFRENYSVNNFSMYYSDNCSNFHYEKEKSSSHFKIHITYTHFLESTDKLANENFKFFLDFAYEPCSKILDYTFIFNKNILKNVSKDALYYELNSFIDYKIVKKMKSCKNTKIIQRLNIGHDLCAIKEMLDSPEWKIAEKKYNFYFFINSSVRGPFLPSYWINEW